MKKKVKAKPKPKKKISQPIDAVGTAGYEAVLQIRKLGYPHILVLATPEGTHVSAIGNVPKLVSNLTASIMKG